MMIEMNSLGGYVAFAPFSPSTLTIISYLMGGASIGLIALLITILLILFERNKKDENNKLK